MIGSLFATSLTEVFSSQRLEPAGRLPAAWPWWAVLLGSSWGKKRPTSDQRGTSLRFFAAEVMVFLVRHNVSLETGFRVTCTGTDPVSFLFCCALNHVLPHRTTPYSIDQHVYPWVTQACATVATVTCKLSMEKVVLGGLHILSYQTHCFSWCWEARCASQRTGFGDCAGNSGRCLTNDASRWPKMIGISWIWMVMKR